MDLEDALESQGDLRKLLEIIGGIGMLLIFLAEAKFFVGERDDGIFAEIGMTVDIPAGTDLFATVPPQGHVCTKQGQTCPCSVGGGAGFIQERSEFWLLADELRIAPGLFVFFGQADGGGRRRLFPRPPTGGQVHHGLSHSVSIRRRKSSKTRWTVRSLMPSRSPISLLESPSAFISKIERFSSGTSERRRPKTSCA